jgi:hypothetical protein
MKSVSIPGKNIGNGGIPIMLGGRISYWGAGTD